MKQPKTLTRKQKECLSANGLNWKDYGFVEKTDFYNKFINKKTGQIKKLDRYKGGKEY